MLKSKWRRNRSGGNLGEIDARLRRFDGRHRWFLFRHELLRDEKNNIIRSRAAATDVEDLKAVEQNLRGEEGAFSLPFHPDDIERVANERSQGLANGVPFELEVRVLLANGEYRWHLMQYNPQLNEHGQIIRWCTTATDVNADKRTAAPLPDENIALREELDRSSIFEGIVGSCEPIRRVLTQVVKVAPSDSTVLVLGETGTGKELIAHSLHRRSHRAERPFVRVNCAAIPQSLIASELFGHEKGAFTGALQRRLGRFEAADGGTLFLDEVGDLPMDVQIALLRVLQEREIERVGSHRPISINIRLIAATNLDLGAAVAAGTFREDLFYRLNVFPITVPPLRERNADIPALVEHFVHRYARRAGKSIRHISKTTLKALKAYHWPGNIRELQNIVERAVILSESDTLSIDENWLSRDPLERPNAPKGLSALAESEIAMIESALAGSHGRISGPAGAAAKLGIPRQTLESKIKKLGINKYAVRQLSR